MSSNESGSGFNWRLMLTVGAPIAISLAAVVTIYVYYSRKKRGNASSDIDTSGNKKENLADPVRQPTPENNPVSEEEEAALKRLMEKKSQANSCFTQKEFDKAVELYTEIIEESPDIPALRPDLAKIYHNRAVTYDKLRGEDMYQKIIADCTKAIFIDPKYCKARVRRAKAHEAQGDIMNSLKDWTLVGLLDPQLAESDASYLKVDSLVKEKGALIANEVMKTHVVLMPSKVAVEDFLNLFNDSEIYAETQLIDLHSQDTGIEAVNVKQDSINKPSMASNHIDSNSTENGIPTTTENDTSTAENSSESNVIEIETDKNISTNDSESFLAENVSIPNGGNEVDVKNELEVEPFWRAVALIRNRQYGRIVELTTEAIATGCRVFQPHALILRSTFYLILCKNQEAIEDVDALLRLGDISPQMRISGLLRRACALEALEKYDNAQDDFQQALQIDPNNHSIYLVRSKFYASDDHPDINKALSDISKCLSLRPDNNLAGRCYYALLRYKMASTSQSIVDLEKAKRHLKETMKQFPNSCEPISLYVQIMIDVQELKEASQYLEKAIAMDPDNGILYVYRAQCNMSMKGANIQNFGMIDNPHTKEAMKQAFEELEYAMKIDNQCGVAMEVLSSMYSQVGDTARGLEYLEMAIKHTRTKQEMVSLQTFKLMLSFQPEITAEIQNIGLDPTAVQNYIAKQY